MGDPNQRAMVLQPQPNALLAMAWMQTSGALTADLQLCLGSQRQVNAVNISLQQAPIGVTQIKNGAEV
jgi:hypothetical protein